MSNLNNTSRSVTSRTKSVAKQMHLKYSILTHIFIHRSLEKQLVHGAGRLRGLAFKPPTPACRGSRAVAAFRHQCDDSGGDRRMNEKTPEIHSKVRLWCGNLDGNSIFCILRLSEPSMYTKLHYPTFIARAVTTKFGRKRFTSRLNFILITVFTPDRSKSKPRPVAEWKSQPGRAETTVEDGRDRKQEIEVEIERRRKQFNIASITSNGIRYESTSRICKSSLREMLCGCAISSCSAE
ncbi:hypothetical protein EVAR_13536_1 [Eumeta japonica]|uniref:Uncharacterized protein n=1 Tax=Eumeta variegata TaxID=151549 RepID=A0A4C1UA34_EUMVA|nr:hypothetical protein EVAR_13536_1 [Eumeta japonica]